ncbi:MAG TPA: hypothetical protein PLU72_05660 [Candidatus Ozemobacteraceae bacterium]|nr:hypothetical protein [Candidatus Ozemobacteraceae bacterium]HQG27227.1 hypothetical protein [Candidatus Ozemobacteraceae bacterium]
METTDRSETHISGLTGIPGTRELLLLLLTSLTAYGVAFHLMGWHVMHELPHIRISEAARSIWRTGSLEPPEYRGYASDAIALSLKSNLPVWQDAFALGARGELYPKHGVFTAIVAALFFGVFGEAGFLIFNELLIVTLFLSLRRIAAGWGIILSPLATVLGLGLGTQLLLHSYSFSYEVFANTLLFAGFAVAAFRPATGGFIAGLSVLAHPALLIVCPFGFLLLPPGQFTRVTVLRYFAGMAAAGLCIGLVNTALWGGFFVTAYHRLPEYHAGTMRISVHPMGFDPAILVSDWWEKLFHHHYGLLFYNPVLIGVIFLPWLLRRTPHRRFFTGLLMIGAVNALHIFSFCHWRSSGFGNKYVFPGIIATALAVAAACATKRNTCEGAASEQDAKASRRDTLPV